MINSHTSVAIAQTVFYAPAVPVSVYLLVRNWHNGTKLASWALVPFCVFRLAGGILVIVLEQSAPDNTGLVIASLVLLGIGMVPLIAVTSGLLSIVRSSIKQPNRLISIFLDRFRTILVIPLALLIASGSLADSASQATVSKDLSRAAYIVLLALWAALGGVQIRFVRLRSELGSLARTILTGTIFAMPFLLVRMIYSLLDVFAADYLTSMWSPLFGNAVAFALMGLLLEYVVLCIYVYLGFKRMQRAAAGLGDDHDGIVALESVVKDEPSGVGSGGR